MAYTLTGVRGNDDERSTPKVMYRNIEEIIGKKTCSSTGCLKTREGSIIMDKEKILERWAEYIRELFEDNRKEHDVMKKNFAGPPIMKDEVREAIRKMKTGKATGPDGLSIKLIEALEEYGIEKVTTLLNEIYDTGQIPVDMSRSIFYSTTKETRSNRLRTSPNHQPHEPRYKAAFKNHHDESKKQNKSINGSKNNAILYKEKEEQMPSSS